MRNRKRKSWLHETFIFFISETGIATAALAAVFGMVFIFAFILFNIYKS